jgi:chromosome partitioning protein
MKTILIAAQKGGAGKSTLAAHFSVLADKPGQPSVIIDADPQGSIAYWHSIREAETPLLVKSEGRDIDAILADARASDIETTIIDSPPHAAAIIASLMRRADLTVVPVRPGPFDLAAAGATFEMARAVKAPFVAVINHAPPPRGEGEPSLVAECREALKAMGVPVLPSVVSQRVALSHALIAGRSVFEFEPESRAAAEVREAWRLIQQIVHRKPL